MVLKIPRKKLINGVTIKIIKAHSMGFWAKKAWDWVVKTTSHCRNLNVASEPAISHQMRIVDKDFPGFYRARNGDLERDRERESLERDGSVEESVAKDGALYARSEHLSLG